MTVTSKDTYDVAGKVLEIPVEKIHPAPDNVRTELDDIEGMAASILEVGVLEPILVFPDDDGDTFTILAGERRHAGAQLAGLLTIPAIVNVRLDNAKRAIAMLIENVQRRDLTAIDEARAFDRLVGYGVGQDDIAKRVGCSQAHVSKRLSLLQLPDECKTLLNAGELTIGDALEIAKLGDRPEVIAELVDGWENLDTEERRYAIEEALEDVERTEALATAEAEATAAGVTLLDEQQAGRNAQIVTPDEYTYRKHIELSKADAKKHAKESCHAAAISWAHGGGRAGGRAVTRIYCLDVARHGPKGDSKIKAKVTERNERAKSTEQVARDRREKEIKRHRSQFVTDLVRSHKLDRPSVIATALQHLALSGYKAEHEKRAKILGLDLNGRDVAIALADYVNGGTDNVARACLAAMLANATGSYVNTETMELLERLGYEPSPVELEERQAAAERIEARQAEADAWDAHERVTERAHELGVESDRYAELESELAGDGELSPARAREIQAECDAIFAELNNLQPGDVVEGEPGAHTIEREPDEEAPDISAPQVREENEYSPSSEEPDSSTKVSSDGCPSPRCIAPAEHDGDHIVPPNVYAKAPKDCGFDESWSRQRIDDVLAVRPDDPEVQAIHEELLAGIDDEARAKEIRNRLDELVRLTDYLESAGGPMEKKCRDYITSCPADHERVIALQQQLYRGVKTGAASAVLRELKKIKGAK